jgi:hypothetical protein
LTHIYKDSFKMWSTLFFILTIKRPRISKLAEVYLQLQILQPYVSSCSEFGLTLVYYYEWSFHLLSLYYYNIVTSIFPDVYFLMVGPGLSFVLLTRDSKTICRTKVRDVPESIKVYVDFNLFQLIMLSSD